MDAAGDIAQRLVSYGGFHSFQSCCMRNDVRRFASTWRLIDRVTAFGSGALRAITLASGAWMRRVSHPGDIPRWTHTRYGNGRLGAGKELPRRGTMFDTLSLRGLWLTTPYLHYSNANPCVEVFNPGHRTTSRGIREMTRSIIPSPTYSRHRSEVKAESTHFSGGISL